MLLYTLTIGRADHGQTIAAVLHRRLNMTWSQAKDAVRGRRVKVNRGPCTDVDYRLKAGSKVEVHGGAPADATPPKRRPPRRPAEELRWPDGLPRPQVVYSDGHIAIVDKPAGVTTVRNREDAEEFTERDRKFLPKTLLDHLPALLGEFGRGGAVRAVHRLDRDTSGLVAFARTADAERHLTGQFRAHTVERSYQALTRGRPAGGAIRSHIGRNRGDGKRGSVADPADGKRAVTHVQVVEELGEVSLVECRLETGRTHQVRIHLCEAGTPLCGERVYERPVGGDAVPDPTDAARPMLHAAALGLTHPETGDWMSWTSVPPADFQAVRAAVTS